jgi:hypothetical protein
MPLTKCRQGRKILFAVTGLLVVVYFGVLLAHLITSSREKAIAEIEPMFDTECIAVMDIPIYPNIPTPRHDSISVSLQNRPGRQVAIGKGRWEDWAIIERLFPRSRAFKSWDLFSCKKFFRNTHLDVGCDRFSNVFESKAYKERLSNRWDTRWPKGFDGIGNPSALILPHLPLNSLNTVLSGPDLLLSQIQLLFYTLASFTGIGGSLRGLGIQYSSLRLHFFELSVENPSGIDANPKEKKSQENHVPIGIVKPFIGFLWIGMGLLMDFFAMWILRIRARSSNSGSEWGRWVCLAFMALSGSVPLIWHGLDLLS